MASQPAPQAPQRRGAEAARQQPNAARAGLRARPLVGRRQVKHENVNATTSVARHIRTGSDAEDAHIACPSTG